MKKWAAEEAAHRVKGVKAVANDVEVRLPGDSQRTDCRHCGRGGAGARVGRIDAAREARRHGGEGLGDAPGRSGVAVQKEDAERVVRRITGVKGVTNLIAVKPRVTPSELQKKIEDALVRNAATDAERIQIEVQGSKVILKGMVAVVGRARGGGARGLVGGRA